MTERVALPQLHLVTLHHAHHASASGYGRFADHLPAQQLPPLRHWTWQQRLLARFARPLIRQSGLQWYHRDSFIRELQVARHWLRRRGQLFHFLYGENSYRYSGLLRRYAPGNHLICTYHTPPQRFCEVVQQRHHLRHLDAIVVLNRASLPFFATEVASERVHYLPRGVDCDWFLPPLRRPVTAGRLLAVGSHLRDFTALADAARWLQRWRPAVRLQLLTFAANHHHFRGLSNVELLPPVTDRELLRRYQQSDLLLLPLRDATANNVLLEGLACALPLVATDLTGVRDYVTDQCAVLTPLGDGEALAAAAAALLDDSARRQQMATAARKQALHFGLRRTAERLLRLYQQVANDA